MKRKILVFGGAFSPPTLAHEAIIAACLDLPDFDQVWLMPSGDRSDKTMSMSGRHRMEMLRQVKQSSFANDPRLAITDFELGLPHPNRTYRTVQEMFGQYHDNDFWFVFGADSYRDMPNWEHGVELQKQLKMVVFGDTGLPSLPANVQYILLDQKLGDISSTKARRAMSDHQSLDGLVSPPVARYLQQLL